MTDSASRDNTAGPAGPVDSDHEPGRTAGDQPAANQGAAEPMPPSPSHSQTDDDGGVDAMAAHAGGVATVPSPGHLAGEPGTLAPDVYAARGTSEQVPEVTPQTALAQPGKPDGEPAT